ncbi:uncharacterized protein Dere_GG15811, isoform B [Drosophila erecta]|uniref:Uncharacterized protein, isoform B n=1 Tax=Drosophila erecta TaxID=7220 RepID=A0A0Q5U4M7_DROER|nr:uncharacterized protein Dere_GG15811, isoform B [Drosophila erecta]
MMIMIIMMMMPTIVLIRSPGAPPHISSMNPQIIMMQRCLRLPKLLALRRDLHLAQVERQAVVTEAPEAEPQDAFERQYFKERIEISPFQRVFLAAGSSIAALLDPRRHDMIACLGETTGEDALWTILDSMQASEEGQRIMADKPRIHTSTIDFKYLETLPPDTFGAAYVKFLNVRCVFAHRFGYNFGNQLLASHAGQSHGREVFGGTEVGLLDDAVSRMPRPHPHGVGHAHQYARRGVRQVGGGSEHGTAHVLWWCGVRSSSPTSQAAACVLEALLAVGPGER